MLEYADPNAVPNDWRTRQPGCAIWCIIAIPRVILLIIFYGLLYNFSPLLPNTQWTYTQALRTQLIKTAFFIIREVGFTQSLTLEAGDTGDKWVTINPAATSAYRGPFTSNQNVKPEVIGGTWYRMYNHRQNSSQTAATTTMITVWSFCLSILDHSCGSQDGQKIPGMSLK